MKVSVKRVDNDFHMEAVNDTGNVVLLDGNPEIGGHNLGARPMQLLLMGLGGCSSIDLISILRKQHQELDSLEVIVDGEREPGAIPAVFTKIHIEFHIGGDVDRNKAQRAAALSMEKYCSVSKMLEKTAEITYEIIYKS
jgi:putative redox protein